MPTLVELPDGTELEFPDGMDQSAMQQAIAKSFPQFVKTAAPQSEVPSAGERMIQKAFTPEGLPEPIKRISGGGGFQQPAIEVAPFWTTPPWVPAAKLLGFPKVAEAGQAMAEETANTISGLTTPVNVGLVAATKAYPPLGVAIAASMIPQIYEGGKQAYKGMTTGDIPEVVRGGTKAAIGTAGAVLGTLPWAARFLPRATAEAAKIEGPLPGTKQTRTGTVTIERSDIPTPSRVPTKEAIPIQSETSFTPLTPQEEAALKAQAEPEPLSQADVDRLFLDKLNEESNREVEAASAAPKPAPLTPTEQAEARADLAAELGEEPQAPVAPEPAPAPETPPEISAAEAKAPELTPPAKVEAPAAKEPELADYPDLAPKPAAKPAAETGKEMGEPFQMSFEQFLNAPREGRLLDELRKLPRSPKTETQLAAQAKYDAATESLEKSGLSWVLDRADPKQKAMVDAAMRKLPKAKQKIVAAYESALNEQVKASRSGTEGQRRLYDKAVEAGIIKPPETPPTGPGVELGMYIIPPQLKRSLKTFAIQDIAPALRAGVNTGKAAKDAIIHSLSPASAAEPRVVDTMFKSKGYSEQVMTQAAAAMEDANKQVRVMPRAEQIAFVDRVKRGQAQPTQELTDLADLMRRWDDYLYSEAQVYKPGLAYLDNHMRVLWKTIPGSTTRRGTSQQQVLSKRPWRGSQGFTKRHVLDDMSEGIALGGEPVTYNPVEMFLLHAQDVMKFVAANRAWKSLKGTGDVTFVKFGRKPPDDFVRINDSIAKAYFTPPGMKGVRAQTGEWWVQKDAARLIENYLSKDRIRNNPVGRALMGLKNATTAIELGLSPFHAVFESLETMGSTFGLGLSKISSGDIVSGLKTVAETPISPKTVSKLGRAGIKYAKNAADFQATEPEAYNWFVNKFPGAAQLIDDMFAGGGQIGMHQDYKFRAGTGFGQALQEGNYPGAVLRAVPALNQAVMKPLFQIYIPRLKVGTFLREYSFELARRADDLAAGKITREQIARKTWAFVEDRFGEMNFDNLYWDRTFKSALQLLFRSVTWKLGNLRGFGKAARDATAELGWRWFTQGRAPEMTMPMAWALGMSVTTAAVSSLVTKAATGKYPWELAEHAGELVKNLVFPRISLTDESQRVSTPTYWRDAVHLSHSVPSYVSSSMSGEKGRITDVWNNRDFYGVQVYNPDDPIPQKVAQAMQHLIPVPFGASSWLAAERTGATRGQALAGFFGFTKAPYYISHTAAEQKGLELVRSRMPQGSRTRDEFERSIRERQAVEAIKRGDMTVQEAFRDGLVTQDRMKQVQRRSTEPLLENLVTRLSAEDSLRVYKAAEPEEKDRLKFRLQQKILRSNKTPAEKGQLLVELEK